MNFVGVVEELKSTACTCPTFPAIVNTVKSTCIVAGSLSTADVFRHAWREFRRENIEQRWSPRGRPWPRGRPRGQILKSLALASRPQVLENWPVLGSRTALFFGKLKFCGAVEKFFGKRFFVEIA